MAIYQDLTRLLHFKVSYIAYCKSLMFAIYITYKPN